jgi:hypothetical protein
VQRLHLHMDHPPDGVHGPHSLQCDGDQCLLQQQGHHFVFSKTKPGLNRGVK